MHRSGVHGRGVVTLLLGLVLIAAAVALAVYPRLHGNAALKESAQLNVPTVSVIEPKLGSETQELVLPGTLQAMNETPIYARTNGYLKRRLADIGSVVKAGALLAEIDTPEVDDQLAQAQADLATAAANYELAQKTAARWQRLLETHTVSQQAADQALGERQAKKAALDSARFNVARLQKLQSFKKIYAPFEGLITVRNVDVGALISAGTADSTKPLFHIAAAKGLRVFVNVPQAYAHDVSMGMKAELKLIEQPSKGFEGKLVRTAQAIDTASRTLLTEIEVDNSKGELLPGAYAQVHLKLKPATAALVVPVNALIFRADGVQVALIGAGERVELKPVTLGRDFGTQVEITSGIQASDHLILNPADSLTSGTAVRVVTQAEDKKKQAEEKK
jgi:RND family efflux transporter MFP subunit